MQRQTEITTWAAVLFVLLLLLLQSGTADAWLPGVPGGMPPASGFGGSQFDYWSRCSDLKRAPEDRIRFCKDASTRIGPVYLTQIGNAYTDARDYAHALESYNEAIAQVEPWGSPSYGPPGDLAEVYEQRGELYALMGNAGAALADADDVLKHFPHTAAPYIHRCWIKAIIGSDLKGALADCDEALRQLSTHPDDSALLLARGLAEFKLGDVSAAGQDYAKARDGIEGERTPLYIAQITKPASIYMQGVVKKLKGDAEGGEKDIEEAKSFDPLIAERYASYGVLPPGAPTAAK